MALDLAHRCIDVHLREPALTDREIAERVGCSQDTVSRAIRSWRNRERPGRSRAAVGESQSRYFRMAKSPKAAETLESDFDEMGAG